MDTPKFYFVLDARHLGYVVLGQSGAAVGRVERATHWIHRPDPKAWTAYRGKVAVGTARNRRAAAALLSGARI